MRCPHCYEDAEAGEGVALSCSWCIGFAAGREKMSAEYHQARKLAAANDLYVRLLYDQVMRLRRELGAKGPP